MHPRLEREIDYILVEHENPFIAFGVMTDPQPVSINHLYTNGMHGQRVLTSPGRAYKSNLSAVVARASLEWKRATDLVYQEGAGATLLVALYFEELNNKSWSPGGRTKGGNLKQPRLSKDATNYLKLIEDGVKDGSGIDDCNNMSTLIVKAEDKANPRTELVYIVV